MEPITVVTGLVSLLGGGAIAKGVEWWGKHKAKRLEIEAQAQSAEIKREDTGRHFLEEGWMDERKSHKDCLARVTRIESELFRQQYDHGKEKDRYQAEIGRLSADNARLHRELATMRDALLASFLGDNDKARDLLNSIPPPVPVPAPRLVEVDGRRK